MMALNCLIILVMLPPACFALYLKALANSVFIAFSKGKQDFRGQKIIQVGMSLVLGPPVIILSVLSDLFSLPSMLLEPS